MRKHNVYFYKDKKGRQPVAEYIQQLLVKGDKDSRIKLNKIREYIKLLSEYGTQVGAPYVKYLGDDIWELRPLRDRILFVAWVGGDYILLHQFMKTTQKTPPREIAKAKRALADIKEREVRYGDDE